MEKSQKFDDFLAKQTALEMARFASNKNTSPEDIVKRAGVYLKFLSA